MWHLSKWWQTYADEVKHFKFDLVGELEIVEFLISIAKEETGFEKMETDGWFLVRGEGENADWGWGEAEEVVESVFFDGFEERYCKTLDIHFGNQVFSVEISQIVIYNIMKCRIMSSRNVIIKWLAVVVREEGWIMAGWS